MTEVYDVAPEGRGSATSGRRSRRLTADLWVSVGGVESALTRRRGDLCATGLYIATSDAVGCPGDIVLLGLASGDKTRSIKTLARVARVIRQDDRARGARVIGAAFEFLPLNNVQEDIVDLLQHVATCELMNYGLLRFDDAVRADAQDAEGSTRCELRSLGRTQLALSTPVPLRLEMQLTITVAGSAPDAALSGTVGCVRRESLAGAERYAVLVRLDEVDPSQTEAHAALVRQLLVPESVKKRRGAYYDFAGQIARLPMDEIFSLLARERYTGVLSAGSAQNFFSFTVQEGQILECESALGLARAEAVAHVRELKDGDFKFRNRRPPQLEALARPTARLMQDVLGLGNQA